MELRFPKTITHVELKGRKVPINVIYINLAYRKGGDIPTRMKELKQLEINQLIREYTDGKS